MTLVINPVGNKRSIASLPELTIFRLYGDRLWLKTDLTAVSLEDGSSFETGSVILTRPRDPKDLVVLGTLEVRE